MQYLINVAKNFYADSLYKNSMYLMLSTAVMSFFGFFFWVINARIYTSEQIGLATTIISISTLISTIGILGFNQSIVKFIPKSTTKNDIINSIIILVIPFTIILSVIYLSNIQLFAPKLNSIFSSNLFVCLFIVFNVITILNTIVESYFIAIKDTLYILVKNTISSIIKVFLPILLVSLGSFGIFTSFSFSSLIGLFICIIILYIKFNYHFKFNFNRKLIKDMGVFTFANYLASLIGVLPTLIMPTIITNNLNPKITAYFYIDMMIINLLLIIPSATSQSLFAEGAHNELNLQKYLIQSSKIISIFLIPAIIITIFFGKYILLAFGKEFSDEGIIFLRIMSISVIFGAINYICWTLLKIKAKNKLIIFSTIAKSALIIITSYLLIHLGLIGIGIAWLISEILTSIIYLYITFKK